MKKILYITAFLTICLQSSVLPAQKRSEKCLYTFERMEKRFPWLNSDNAAGLVSNQSLNFATVGAYWGNSNGGFRNFNEAESANTFGVKTESYVKTKKVFFYGSFNYEYGIKQNQAWLGTYNENTALNPILDSIPGKVLHESYNLKGKAGYALNDYFALGAAFDYTTATAAKRVDGRNKNVLSRLNAAPGITYRNGHFTAGINLAYQRNVEDVDYDYIGDVTGKHIYYMEGLWFYTREGITSTTLLRRAYYENVYGGALQIQFKNRNISFFNQLKVDYNTEDDFEETNLTKRYAFVEGLRYNYRGDFLFKGSKMDHNVALSFINDEKFSYTIDNVYEQIPDEINSWAWNEYGKTLRYMQQKRQYGAEYKAYVRRDDWNCSWVFTLGGTLRQVEKDFKIYPASYHQDYSNTEVYAKIEKNFIFAHKSLLDLNLNGAYISGKGTMLESSNPMTTGALKLNNNILNYDFKYNTAERYSVGGGFKFSHIVNPDRGMVAYIGANYRHLFTTNNLLTGIQGLVLPGANRSMVSVSVGMNF